MDIEKLTDELLEKLSNAKYEWNSGRESYTSSVLSRLKGNERVAARQAIIEWLQQYIINDVQEIEMLKCKVKFLEEMVSKSNFKPFVQNEVVESNKKAS